MIPQVRKIHARRAQRRVAEIHFSNGGAKHQRPENEGKRHAEADQAEIKQRWMNHHFRILEQGVHAVAVGRYWAGRQSKGQGHEVQQQKKKDLNAGKNGRHQGDEPYRGIKAESQHKAIP